MGRVDLGGFPPRSTRPEAPRGPECANEITDPMIAIRAADSAEVNLDPAKTVPEEAAMARRTR
jgi:hypothetical protein